MKKHIFTLVLIGFGIAFACAPYPKDVETNPAVKAQRFPAERFDSVIEDHVEDMISLAERFFGMTPSEAKGSGAIS